MVAILFVLGLILLAIGMFVCVEVPNDRIALTITIVTGAIGVMMLVWSVVLDHNLRDEYRQKEWLACKAAGGSYVVITAGDQPDLCVNGRNVILPAGWFDPNE